MQKEAYTSARAGVAKAKSLDGIPRLAHLAFAQGDSAGHAEESTLATP